MNIHGAFGVSPQSDIVSKIKYSTIQTFSIGCDDERPVSSIVTKPLASSNLTKPFR